jgi:hypothetical protein
LATVAVVTVALVAGLRAHQQNGGAVPPAPAPTSAPKGDLYVVIEPGKSGNNVTPDTIRFLRHDGTLVRSVPFPGSPDVGHSYESVGGDQLFYVAAGPTGYELTSIGMDGKAHDHGSLQNKDWIFTGVAVSQDGTHWAWTEHQLLPGGPPLIGHERLHVGGMGEPDHVLKDETTPKSPGEIAIKALAWTDRGIVVGRTGIGIGGDIPFTSWGAPRLVDPLTGTARDLGNCGQFESMGPDGSYVCSTNDPATFTVFDANGHARRTFTPAAPVVIAGNAVTSADGRQLAVGVMETDGPYPRKWRTDIVDVATGRVTHPAPADFTAATWLLDGSLVAFNRNTSDMREDTADSLRVLAPDGHATNIGPGGYVGIIHG